MLDFSVAFDHSEPVQVAIMNSLTVNLHLLFASPIDQMIDRRTWSSELSWITLVSKGIVLQTQRQTQQNHVRGRILK